MDDLVQKLDRLLSSDDGMKQIEDLMSTLGGSSPAPSPPTDTAPPLPLPDIGMLLKLLPLLGELGKEDESAALLRALRPHLQHERQKRLDEAGQMLRLMRLLPLLGDLKKGDDNT